MARAANVCGASKAGNKCWGLTPYLAYGICYRMGEMRKITVEVPADTLEIAMRDGGGLAETVREALKEFAHKRACERILAMEGKLDLGLDLEELRKDKDEE